MRLSRSRIAGLDRVRKSVFNVEYRSLQCAQADAWQFGSILKNTGLYDVPWTPCR